MVTAKYIVEILLRGPQIKLIQNFMNINERTLLIFTTAPSDLLLQSLPKKYNFNFQIEFLNKNWIVLELDFFWGYQNETTNCTILLNNKK